MTTKSTNVIPQLWEMDNPPVAVNVVQTLKTNATEKGTSQVRNKFSPMRLHNSITSVIF